jgi:hypothetical protein
VGAVDECEFEEVDNELAGTISISEESVDVFSESEVRISTRCRLNDCSVKCDLKELSFGFDRAAIFIRNGVPAIAR